MRRDGFTAAKIRKVIAHLMDKGHLMGSDKSGVQSRIAEHFHVSRQRVAQLVAEERKRRAE